MTIEKRISKLESENRRLRRWVLAVAALAILPTLLAARSLTVDGVVKARRIELKDGDTAMNITANRLEIRDNDNRRILLSLTEDNEGKKIADLILDCDPHPDSSDDNLRLHCFASETKLQVMLRKNKTLAPYLQRKLTEDGQDLPTINASN